MKIMHIQIKINTEIEITTLTDLPRLKLLMEGSNMKVNKSQLAREMGVDRRTIEKYLNGYIPTNKRNKSSKIDSLYTIIQDLLSETSPQRFYYKRMLWQYLVDNHSLECSVSNFRTYISNKPEFQRYFSSNKGRVNHSKSVIRYETLPAEQAQLDWKENIKYITSDGEIIYVNVLVITLSYSRFRVYQMSVSKTQNILFSFLTEAFEIFDGVPKTLLVDNMKTVMDEPRMKYKKGKVNNRFEQFSKDFGFEVKPCISGRPQTKGKVESSMKLLDEIYAYQTQFTYEELNQFVQKLCERVNHAPHQGTGKVPILLFKQEKDLLLPLPRKQIRDQYKIHHQLAKVNPSNMISYKSNQYSVPPGYIGKQVQLQIVDDHLYIYYSMELLVRHTITLKKLNYKDEHYIHHLQKQLPYKDEIEEMALNNLAAIDEVYKNE